MASGEPRRGEIWLVALGAGRAGEAGKTRPAIVVSVDELNTGGAEELIVVVPVSSSSAPSALRVDVGPTAGIDRPSRALPRGVRAVVASRLIRRIGHVEPEVMRHVEEILVLILGLDRRADSSA